MKKGVGKNKAKGTEYNKLKSLKKTKRFEEEKEAKRRSENKRKNSEFRKEKEEKKSTLQKGQVVRIVDYKKNMLIVEVEGELEKRALIFPKSRLTRFSLESQIEDMEIKLYGVLHKINTLDGFEETKSVILFYIEDTL